VTVQLDELLIVADEEIVIQVDGDLALLEYCFCASFRVRRQGLACKPRI